MNNNESGQGVQNCFSNEVEEPNVQETCQEEIRHRPSPPVPSEEALDTVNTLTLSPRMKEALAFVATEEPAEKKLERPHSGSLEALERRGLIFLSSTVDDCSLTDEGRRAFEAIQSG